MEKIGKAHTYVYFRKRQAAWMFFVPFLLASVFAWHLYKEIRYDTWYKKVSSKRYEKVAQVSVPFRFPSSLYRISLIDLLFMMLFASLALIFLHCLLHRGPVYIITPEGIMDCKRGFVPWHQTKRITLQELNPGKTMFIALKDPVGHFGGNLRSFFGTRGLGFSPDLMWCKEVVQPDGGLHIVVPHVDNKQ